ncbi:hypothetical protein [Singulisphaera acidiphila]|uniref:Uncharacterized protein n=1 Tax=Singulisphaera acidiphila (strain ATCC BAA-1392 / DSM 18658 / VKM B-2454 / MOB10) TaxID=886293 RepID=L0DD96_SINAD|nr:hypothetical protein [Singulisphaera acidiphila]AGA26808.1 hypothetical protein Sinac_2500 [Singulisphaera acidiphila DSM 18658]
MNPIAKPYIHLTIDAVDLVAFDPEGRYDADRYDRYATFDEARNAALSSIELMLDEQDYDDEAHRQELETMLPLLESSHSFDDLKGHAEYRAYFERLELAASRAA